MKCIERRKYLKGNQEKVKFLNKHIWNLKCILRGQLPEQTKTVGKKRTHQAYL